MHVSKNKDEETLTQTNLNPWENQAICGYSFKTKLLLINQDKQLNQNFSVFLLAHNIGLAGLSILEMLVYSCVA